MGLTIVKIPNSVSTIGSYAFYGCSGLTSIEIPNSVTTIGNCAFGACDNLLSITSLIDNPYDIGENVFSLYYENASKMYFDSNKKLYVPKGTKMMYEERKGWKLFSNIIEIETTTIEQSEMTGMNKPTTLGQEYFDLNGRCISQPRRGLNILRMSDGTVRKVMIK